MFKTLFSNLFKRSILIALLIVVLNIVITPNHHTTYAAATVCTNDFSGPICETQIAPNASDADKAAISCPANYQKAIIDNKVVRCTKNGTASEINSEKLFESLGTIKLVADVLNKLLWPILALIGGLLDNTLLFGNGMEARLREIWIVIRNLVNIFFVVVLVGIALYNVLGLGEDGSNYSVKAALPKIIIALIAINFSFLGIKVFLDGVNIMTTAVFALPEQVDASISEINLTKEAKLLLCAKVSDQTYSQLTNYGSQIQEDPIADPANLQQSTSAQKLEVIYRDVANQPEFKNSAFSPSLTDNPNMAEIKSKLKRDRELDFNQAVSKKLQGEICDENGFTAAGNEYFSKYNHKNAAFAMALNMGKITLYDTATFDSLLNLKSIEKLTISAIFSVILYFVYAASFIALFIVLLARLIFMWISIAISPVLLLLLASPELKGASGSLGELVDNFVKNAIAPILIGLTMSIGWIMISSLQNINTLEQGPLLGIDPTNGLPVSGLNTLQDLLVACATVGIIWIGVFSAADQTIAKGATGWIKDKIRGAGEFAAKIPIKHTPFIPIKIGDQEKEFSAGEVIQAFNEKLYDASQPNRAKVNLLKGVKDDGTQPPATYAFNQIRDAQGLKKIFADAMRSGGLTPEQLRELKKVPNDKMNEILRELSGSKSSEDHKLAEILRTDLPKAEEDKDFKEIYRKIDNINHPEFAKKAEEKTPSAPAPAPANLTPITLNTNVQVNGKNFDNMFPVIQDEKLAVFKADNGLDPSLDREGIINAEKDRLQTGINDLATALNSGTLDQPAISKIRDNLIIKHWDTDGATQSVKPTKEEIKALIPNLTITEANFTALGITQ